VIVSIYPFITYPPPINLYNLIHTLIPFESERLHLAAAKNSNHLYRLIYILIYHINPSLTSFEKEVSKKTYYYSLFSALQRIRNTSKVSFPPKIYYFSSPEYSGDEK